MKTYLTCLLMLSLLACKPDADVQPEPIPPVDTLPTPPPGIFEGLTGTIVYEGQIDSPPVKIRYSVLGVIDVATRKSRELKFADDSKGLIRYQYPRLSKDASRIYFCSNLHGESANFDIYSVKVDGTDLKRVTSTPDISETFASLSPDESMIAYVAIDKNLRDHLFVMNADGSSAKQLTTQTENMYEYKNPIWTNDGKKIIFSCANKFLWEYDIAVHDIQASSTSLIKRGITLIHSLSPDGNHLMYFRSVYDNPELFSMNLDGANDTQLTNYKEITTDGAWSQDGSFIAMSSTKESKDVRNCEIFIAWTKNTNHFIKIPTPANDKYNLDWR